MVYGRSRWQDVTVTVVGLEPGRHTARTKNWVGWKFLRTAGMEGMLTTAQLLPALLVSK